MEGKVGAPERMLFTRHCPPVSGQLCFPAQKERGPAAPFLLQIKILEVPTKLPDKITQLCFCLHIPSLSPKDSSLTCIKCLSSQSLKRDRRHQAQQKTLHHCSPLAQEECFCTSSVGEGASSHSPARLWLGLLTIIFQDKTHGIIKQGLERPSYTGVLPKKHLKK